MSVATLDENLDRASRAPCVRLEARDDALVVYYDDGGRTACLGPMGDDVVAQVTDAGYDFWAPGPEVSPTKRMAAWKELVRANRAGQGAEDCDDWLAQELRELKDARARWSPRDSRGSFNRERFDELLKANGVSFEGRWATMPERGGRGWEGRYRMCGRKKLERAVLRSGYLLKDGEKVPAPRGWLERMAKVHRRVRPCYEEEPQ